MQTKYKQQKNSGILNVCKMEKIPHYYKNIKTNNVSLIHHSTLIELF